MCCLNINAYVTGIWLCLCTSRTPRELPQATTLDNRASMAHLVDEQGMGAWEWVPGRDREMEPGGSRNPKSAMAGSGSIQVRGDPECCRGKR